MIAEARVNHNRVGKYFDDIFIRSFYRVDERLWHACANRAVLNNHQIYLAVFQLNVFRQIGNFSLKCVRVFRHIGQVFLEDFLHLVRLGHHTVVYAVVIENVALKAARILLFLQDVESQRVSFIANQFLKRLGVFQLYEHLLVLYRKRVAELKQIGHSVYALADIGVVLVQTIVFQRVRHLQLVAVAHSLVKRAEVAQNHRHKHLLAFGIDM